MTEQPIRDHMTRDPLTIGIGQTLARAHEVMRTRGIRHLPVLDGDRLVGVISQRDLYFIETLKDVDPATVLVDEAMVREPYTVGPDAPIATVAQGMLRHKHGAAIVVAQGRVLGIFTTHDALKVLVASARHAKSAPARSLHHRSS
jgi:acetoin utilization protein AcuB